MASQSKLTVRVTSSRGGSKISVTSGGRYVSLVTNTVAAELLEQPIQPTASEAVFWTSVLAAVQLAIGEQV
jgi:hypothetical protein